MFQNNNQKEANNVEVIEITREDRYRTDRRGFLRPRAYTTRGKDVERALQRAEELRELERSGEMERRTVEKRALELQRKIVELRWQLKYNDERSAAELLKNAAEFALKGKQKDELERWVIQATVLHESFIAAKKARDEEDRRKEAEYEAKHQQVMREEWLPAVTKVLARIRAGEQVEVGFHIAVEAAHLEGAGMISKADYDIINRAEQEETRRTCEENNRLAAEMEGASRSRTWHMTATDVLDLLEHRLAYDCYGSPIPHKVGMKGKGRHFRGKRSRHHHQRSARRGHQGSSPTSHRREYHLAARHLGLKP